MNTLKINGERLWSSLQTLGKIGGTAKGGCNRQALTDEDQTGRDLFIRWCLDIGCTLRIDAMGNLFLRKAGRNDSLPPVLMGSHLDTQPTGGKFDGVYGVLAGLEVLRTLHDAKFTTHHPLEVVVWTNEEGARFSPAMIGSGVWSGSFDLEYAWQRTDKAGVSIKDELEKRGYLGTHPCQAFPVKAAFEAHIEQGPVLEALGKPIGIVEGVQGMRWYDLIIHGQPVHAGPTPMAQRRDPMKAMAKIVDALYDVANTYAPQSRVTFGDIRAEPGARNTVPETLTLAVDLRHPEQSTLQKMEAEFKALATQVCQTLNLNVEIREEWDSPAVTFDKACVNAARNAAKAEGFVYEEMFSGAGHDSVYLAKVAPTGMIFIPCKGGISHNEAEYAKPEHVTAGCQVLLGAVLQMSEESV